MRLISRWLGYHQDHGWAVRMSGSAGASDAVTLSCSRHCSCCWTWFGLSRVSNSFYQSTKVSWEHCSWIGKFCSWPESCFQLERLAVCSLNFASLHVVVKELFRCRPACAAAFARGLTIRFGKSWFACTMETGFINWPTMGELCRFITLYWATSISAIWIEFIHLN